MGVLLRVGDWRDLWRQMGAIGVEIPVFLACHIRVVRMGEADRQTPWPRIGPACQIINLGSIRISYACAMMLSCS